MKKSILIFFLGMITGLSFAQDAQFSQFYAAPLYLNPAYAGADSSARMDFNFRNEFPEFGGQYTTYDLEYSQFVNALHGGFGVMAWKDIAGSGTYSTTNFSAIYSFQQHIYKEFNIQIGIQGAYMQENLDWSKLTFGDQLNPRYGYIAQEVAPVGESSFFDLTAGILGFTNEFYGGISVAHITQPNAGFIENTEPLPIKFNSNFGAMIPLDNELNISPNIIYIKQQNFYQIDLGLYVQRSYLVGGLWYRADQSLIATLGFQKWGLMVGYSVDLSLLKSNPKVDVAHEISLGYRFHSKAKNEGFHSINGPSF